MGWFVSKGQIVAHAVSGGDDRHRASYSLSLLVGQDFPDRRVRPIVAIGLFMA